MYGKNNFRERLRKMDMQAKKDRFSIRKISIGVVSILLGFTFMKMNSQVVNADTLDSQVKTKDVNVQSSHVTSKQQQTATSNNGAKVTGSVTKDSDSTANMQSKKSDKVDTFSNLSKFLRSDSQKAKKQSVAANAQQTVVTNQSNDGPASTSNHDDIVTNVESKADPVDSSSDSGSDTSGHRLTNHVKWGSCDVYFDVDTATLHIGQGNLNIVLHLGPGPNPDNTMESSPITGDVSRSAKRGSPTWKWLAFLCSVGVD